MNPKVSTQLHPLARCLSHPKVFVSEEICPDFVSPLLLVVDGLALGNVIEARRSGALLDPYDEQTQTVNTNFLKLTLGHGSHSEQSLPLFTDLDEVV